MARVAISTGRHTISAYTTFVRNITLSADERDIEAARSRARADKTTLNEQFRLWLAGYARPQGVLGEYEQVTSDLRGRLVVGRALTRDEMNER